MTIPQHIYLTGFMGSGKSTLGKKLAMLLKREFIDLDRYIEEKEQRTVSDIFEQEGEEVFRKKESEYLKSLTDKDTPSVISLGGGTICFNENIIPIKQKGLLIYLELTPAAIFSRVAGNTQQRPLLRNLTGDDLLHSIEEKLNERKTYYEQAHITINGLNLNAQQLLQSIIDYYQKNSA